MPTPSIPEPEGPPRRFAVLAPLWLLAFVAVFFSFHLPNHRDYRRFNLLQIAPELLAYNIPGRPTPNRTVRALTDRMLSSVPATASTSERIISLAQQVPGAESVASQFGVLTWWHQQRVTLYESQPETLPAGRTAEQAAWDDVVRIALDGPPSGWTYFPQRLGFVAVALLLWAAAWGLGRTLLSVLRFPADEGRLERFVLALGLGLSGISLFTLLTGLAGLLQRAWFFTAFAGMAAAGAVIALRGFIVRRRSATTSPDAHTQTDPARVISPALPAACIAAIVPFVVAMALGSMLPSTDFDVKEYHLQGPKEFYQQGRVTMLPHNVYTSFPFLTEMLSLAAMVLYGDWYWGALAGKLTLMAFSPLTALAVLAAGRRWFGPVAGWFGFLVHLTTPWTYRISIIAYAEGGLTFYLFTTLLALGLAIERHRAHRPGVAPLYLVSGLLAGSAMACKYPGVLQVVFPLGAAAVVAAFRSERGASSRHFSPWRVAALFALGTAVTVGPWLLKNLAETGNPVYPLMYSVFGGRDWDAAMNAKWKPAHSPPHHHPADLAEKFIDVTLRSDWLSPLLFALAPLALLRRELRRCAGGLWLYVGFLFLSWWLLTHRIDRFWIPMIPVVSLLAGAGAAWTARHAWRPTLALLVPMCVLFNLAFITTPLCGYNAYLIDLNYARESTGAPISALNRLDLPDDARVLCVGEAQVFDARFPVVYHTVFDDSIFARWCGADGWTGPENDRPMRDPQDIRRTFQSHGITHVFVNWQEILRYRLPGSYGYTDFVSPRRFEWLREQGLLGTPIELPNELAEFERRSPDERREIESWAPELIVPIGDTRAFQALQLFPLTPSRSPSSPLSPSPSGRGPG